MRPTLSSVSRAHSLTQIALKIVIQSAEVLLSGGAQQQQSALEGFALKTLGTRFVKVNHPFTSSLIRFRLKRASVSSIHPFCIVHIDGVEVLLQSCSIFISVALRHASQIARTPVKHNSIAPSWEFEAFKTICLRSAVIARLIDMKPLRGSGVSHV